MLVLEKESKDSLYAQIYKQLRDQIIAGGLEENTKLPSTRNLAKTLEVSRNTVETAYQQLFAEGYVSSKAGSSYQVKKIDQELFKNIRRVEEQPVKIVHEQGVANPQLLNFQYGRLSFSEFPLRTYRKLVNKTLLASDIHRISAYNDRKGEAELRSEIMKYIYDSRGVRCEPEQIIICAGILSCLSIISQLLHKSTHRIALEEPCFDTVRASFSNHGYETVPIRVGTDGIEQKELSQSSAQAVYLTPSHQFPTGAVIPVNKRLELIEWADSTKAFIIEDDYDSEFRYNSRPIPSMQSLDNKGRVIYMNTFSKSFAPGIRISFMVLPPSLRDEYQRNFSRYNCSVPWLEQQVMLRFMKEGYWARHLRKVCMSNKKKHEILNNIITEEMGTRANILGKNAGLHILLEVKNGLSEKELIEKAAIAGVTVYPVSNHFAIKKNYTDNMVLIGFSSLTEDEIVKGVRLLRQAWFGRDT